MSKHSGAEIVYNQEFLSQTTALGLTTLFTPTAAGLYRLSAAGNSSSGAPGFTVTWTDDIGSRSNASFNPLNVAGGVYGDEMLIRSVANSPIQIQGTAFGAGPTLNYSIVLEEF